MGTADSSWGPGRLQRSSAELIQPTGCPVSHQAANQRQGLVVFLEDWGVYSAGWSPHFTASTNAEDWSFVLHMWGFVNQFSIGLCAWVSVVTWWSQRQLQLTRFKSTFELTENSKSSISYYLHQGGYVITHVRLFVSLLFVSKIRQKLLDGLSWNPVEGHGGPGEHQFKF